MCLFGQSSAPPLPTPAAQLVTDPNAAANAAAEAEMARRRRAHGFGDTIGASLQPGQPSVARHKLFGTPA
jgi:hypothetical protein